jgi:septal ring factor EnvC (AmiA/AmiB activator)
LEKAIAGLQQTIASQEEKLSQAEEYVSYQRSTIEDLEAEVEKLRAQKASSVFKPLAGGAVSTGTVTARTVTVVALAVNYSFFCGIIIIYSNRAD